MVVFTVGCTTIVLNIRRVYRGIYTSHACRDERTMVTRPQLMDQEFINDDHLATYVANQPTTQKLFIIIINKMIK